MFGDTQRDGHEHLASFDDNLDGMINAFDTIFGSLMVWQDTNSDGVTDIGELSFLSSHGIDGFELQETHEGVTTPGGQIIASSSEERRVGKEYVSTCGSRWWAYH